MCAGWGSGPRKPLTNPFKESLELSPFPSAVTDSKEKEVPAAPIALHSQLGTLTYLSLSLSLCLLVAQSAGSSGGDDSFELLESSDSANSTHTTPEEVNYSIFLCVCVCACVRSHAAKPTRQLSDRLVRVRRGE
jgi:hypothetical protein